MQKTSKNTDHILANTNGQPLYQHLFAVGYLAHHLMTLMSINSVPLKSSAFVSGVLHDIGKTDPCFQIWVKKKRKKSVKTEPSEDGQHIDTTVNGMKKFIFENHPRHQEVSWLFASSMLKDNDMLNNSQYSQIEHGIYWHHSKTYRSKDNNYFDSAAGIQKKFKESLNELNTTKSSEMNAINIDSVMRDINRVMNDVALLTHQYDSSLELPTMRKAFELIDNRPPPYKIYTNINDKLDEYYADVAKNSLNNLLRTAVISADRLVSKLSKKALEEHIENATLLKLIGHLKKEDSELFLHLQNCIEGFDKNSPEIERTQAQKKTSNKLAQLQHIAKANSSDNVAVLQGPAGCGKSKIALEWAKNTNANKIIWVCPRVQVCLGIVNDLTAPDYLPNSHIEIFTGEYKKIITDGMSLSETPDTEPSDYFSGHIVVTTIDQVLSSITTHNKVDALIPFMQSHVVFDEFHELALMPAFNLLFAELIIGKKKQAHNANTLLISATPNYFFTERFLKIRPLDHISIDSFNNSDYKIDFLSYNAKNDISPLTKLSHSNADKTTFVITNTAKEAQVAFILHQEQENSVLLHSKYNKKDKRLWFDKVFNSFKRHGTKEFDVLRSGPIVQASLNISCDCMYTELTNAENWLQRLGRLDRFGKNTFVNEYTTVLSNDAKKSNSTATFLDSLHCWHSTVAWLNFLKNNLINSDVLKLNELYTIYRDFYNDTDSLKQIEKDFLSALKKSEELINKKVMDPIYTPIKARKSDDTVKMANNSLRGDSRFVQMATCHVKNKNGYLHLDFLAQYAYDLEAKSDDTTITESVQRIVGYDDSSRNLVAFMHKKHHNIVDGFKKSYKDYMLLNNAKDSSRPIYLSYIKSDLDKVNSQAHEYAIYYVLTDTQPVGSMQVINLLASQDIAVTTDVLVNV